MAAGSEIRSLTGLRGAAALLVMAYHYRNLGLAGRPLQHSALGPAYLMVDLFFILSGFVMARTYGAAFARGFAWPHYRAFLEARLARVYPLYGVVTLAVFGLTVLLAIGYPTHPARALLTNLLLVQNLGSGLACAACSEKLILPGWSISTEAGAYLLFPVLAGWALFGSRRGAAVFLAACLAAYAVLYGLPLAWLHVSERRGPLDISDGVTLWPLLRCLAGFGVGLVLWRLAQAASDRPAWTDLPADVLLAGSAVLLWFASGADLALVAIFAVLILHVCTDRSPLARLLGSAVPHRAGEWSYAIYLLHWPALMTLPAVLPLFKAAHVPHAWSVALGAMAVWTIVLAGLAHRLIERPARRELRAIFARRPMPISAEPSAP